MRHGCPFSLLIVACSARASLVISSVPRHGWPNHAGSYRSVEKMRGYTIIDGGGKPGMRSSHVTSPFPG